MLSWYWTNQSFPYPSKADHQVSILDVIGFDSWFQIYDHPHRKCALCWFGNLIRYVNASEEGAAIREGFTDEQWEPKTWRNAAKRLVVVCGETTTIHICIMYQKGSVHSVGNRYRTFVVHNFCMKLKTQIKLFKSTETVGTVEPILVVVPLPLAHNKDM